VDRYALALTSQIDNLTQEWFARERQAREGSYSHVQIEQLRDNWIKGVYTACRDAMAIQGKALDEMTKLAMRAERARPSPPFYIERPKPAEG